MHYDTWWEMWPIMPLDMMITRWWVYTQETIGVEEKLVYINTSLLESWYRIFAGPLIMVTDLLDCNRISSNRQLFSVTIYEVNKI